MAQWFRRKRWGYGWTPCSWEGWMVMAVFTTGVFAIGLNVRSLGQVRTLVLIGGLTVILVVVAKATSGRDSDT